MPVVPAVYSTTVPRGESRPSAAAHSIIALAMRSFILPVGFADSNLTTTRAEPAGTTLRSSTNGVLPIASRIFRVDTGHSPQDNGLYLAAVSNMCRNFE